MFAPSPPTGAFRQGEILSQVIQVHIRVDSLNPKAEEIALEEKIHPQAAVLTQDCDLDWDFTARNQGEEGNRLQLKQTETGAERSALRVDSRGYAARADEGRGGRRVRPVEAYHAEPG